MENFKKLGIRENLLRSIKEFNFDKPTEIQEKAIPLVLEGKDVIGNSATGSGKTLVFGAGIIEKVKARGGVQSLILTPTRELAEQVTQTLKKFSKNTHLKIQEVYGGVSISRQIEGIKNAEIVVGTPGRILDHLQRKTLNLSKIFILVLDEADRMADMGFLPDVEKIIKTCSLNRQTLLFSATLSQDINYIANKYMKNPEYVYVESYVESGKLKQYYYEIAQYSKFSLLAHLLKEDSSQLVMVFCNTRRNADILARNLQRIGLKATAIHGGRSQNKRSNIMEQFHKGQIHILVCTDVAARGLDIKNVSHVYNYDTPKNSTEYIHRIGRTARAGKEGEAISLVSNRDYENFNRVISNSALNIITKELPSFENIQFHLPQKRQGNFYRSKHHGRFNTGRSFRDKRIFSDKRSLGRRNRNEEYQKERYKNRKSGSRPGANFRRRY